MVEMVEYRAILDAFRTTLEITGKGSEPSPEAEEIFRSSLDDACAEFEKMAKGSEASDKFSPRVLQNMALHNYYQRCAILDRPVLYVTRIRINPPPENATRVKVAFFQMRLSVDDYFDQHDGLYILREDKKDEIYRSYREAIEALASQGVGLIVFPELSCPPERIPELQQISAKYGVIVVAGSYHDLKNKTNVGTVLSPQGVNEQLKFMKSEYENTEPKNFAVVKIFESPCGRFVVLVCYDVEHPELLRTLRAQRERGYPIEFVLNPAYHLHPERARLKLVNLAQDLVSAAVFVNGSPKGGSFIFDCTKDGFDKNEETTCIEVDRGALDSVRPRGKMAVGGKA